MSKYGPLEGPCGWEQRIVALGLEDVHQILKCASERGCCRCVPCSEQALETLLDMARSEKTHGIVETAGTDDDPLLCL